MKQTPQDKQKKYISIKVIRTSYFKNGAEKHMRLTITSMHASSIHWQRNMVKDDGSCTHRSIHRLNWNVL